MVEQKRLGDICTVVSGGTPTRSKAEYWNNGDIPWVKIGNIKSKYVTEADEFITKAGLEGSSAKMLPKGTILYTIFATLGEVGILDFDACTNQAIAGITIKKDNEILPDYLFYYLKSKKKYVDGIGRGVAQNNINLSILRDFRVPVPGMETQKGIVQALDSVCQIVSKRKQQLQKLDELVKARFVEMFGRAKDRHTDFPTVTLNNVCSAIVRGPFGSALKKEFFVPKATNTYKVYEQKHAIQKRADIGDYYITEAKFETLKRFECHPGDILMSCSGTMGEFYQLPPDCEAGVMNQALCKFTLSDAILPEYFLDYMTQVVDELGSKGSSIKNVSSVKYIKAIQIPLPPLPLQREFAAFVAQVDKSGFGIAGGACCPQWPYNRHSRSLRMEGLLP